MSRPIPLGLILILWLIGEYVAFFYVIGLVGILGAFLIGLGTEVLGLRALQKLGRTGIVELRQQMRSPSERAGIALDHLLYAIGAIFLILPGFLSDIAGLALLSPSLRGWLAVRFAQINVPRNGPKPDQQIIDLAETDWRRIDDPDTRNRK